MAYGGASGGWKGFKGPHLNRSDIAKRAISVHICRGCGLWHEGKKPPACTSCGRMDFDDFMSKTEATWWVKLLRRQERGFIDQLEKQVRIPLLTVHHGTGKPVEWAVFVADFRWREAGERIVAEVKPSTGMSYDAELKIRCCEAMGIPVKLLT